MSSIFRTRPSNRLNTVFLVLVSLSLSLTACAKNDSSSPPTPPPPTGLQIRAFETSDTDKALSLVVRNNSVALPANTEKFAVFAFPKADLPTSFDKDKAFPTGERGTTDYQLVTGTIAVGDAAAGSSGPVEANITEVLAANDGEYTVTVTLDSHTEGQRYLGCVNDTDVHDTNGFGDNCKPLDSVDLDMSDATDFIPEDTANPGVPGGLVTFLAAISNEGTLAYTEATSPAQHTAGAIGVYTNAAPVASYADAVAAVKIISVSAYNTPSVVIVPAIAVGDSKGAINVKIDFPSSTMSYFSCIPQVPKEIYVDNNCRYALIRIEPPPTGLYVKTFETSDTDKALSLVIQNNSAALAADTEKFAVFAFPKADLPTNFDKDKAFPTGERGTTDYQLVTGTIAVGNAAAGSSGLVEANITEALAANGEYTVTVTLDSHTEGQRYLGCVNDTPARDTDGFGDNCKALDSVDLKMKTFVKDEMNPAVSGGLITFLATVSNEGALAYTETSTSSQQHSAGTIGVYRTIYGTRDLGAYAQAIVDGSRGITAIDTSPNAVLVPSIPAMTAPSELTTVQIGYNPFGLQYHYGCILRVPKEIYVDNNCIARPLGAIVIPSGLHVRTFETTGTEGVFSLVIRNNGGALAANTEAFAVFAFAPNAIPANNHLQSTWRTKFFPASGARTTSYHQPVMGTIAVGSAAAGQSGPVEANITTALGHFTYEDYTVTVTLASYDATVRYLGCVDDVYTTDRDVDGFRNNCKVLEIR